MELETKQEPFMPAPVSIGDQAYLRSELERREEPVVELLAPQVQLFAARRIVEDRTPIRGFDGVTHLLRREASHVRAAHQRAHARARHAIERHAQFLQHFEHAEMRSAARAAAAEDEPDARSLGRGLRERFRRDERERRHRQHLEEVSRMLEHEYTRPVAKAVVLQFGRRLAQFGRRNRATLAPAGSLRERVGRKLMRSPRLARGKVG